jgi:bacillithiol biosynthesis cysteine-adding enzyme BshC
MEVVKVPYKQTKYFSNIVIDYLDQKPDIKPFYNLFPTISNFKKQIRLRQSFSDKTRKVLSNVIQKQYKNIDISDATTKNISLLKQSNTFTITTGHQLNLFTGPLYFLYKIISVINLTDKLKKEYPEYNFVPLYWMATEDHDFEEINYFNFKNNKLKWEKDSKGAVGRLDTKGLQSVFAEFKKLLDNSDASKYLLNLFKESYLEYSNLSKATRYLTNELFKKYGLVILDADEKSLKNEFSSYIKNELENQIAFDEINKTNSELSKKYKIQVNPRKINLFYLKDNLRERIVLENNKYIILNTNISFTKMEILDELKNYPERFSPNVIMRPLYQEFILPNLAYIGGGGELAYWFELKKYFDRNKIPFPILSLRNSVLLLTEKELKKLNKLKVSIPELFLEQHILIKNKIKQISNLKLDFSKQKEVLEKQFQNLEQIAKQTDKSFVGAVKAQKRKQIKGLENLEKRLLIAEKRKHIDFTNRLVNIQDKLFPNYSLQERQVNFSEYYLELGSDLIQIFKENLDPLTNEFTVIAK